MRGTRAACQPPASAEGQQRIPLKVNGDHFWLPGRSTAKWREWTGNAVPPQSAQAVAEQMLATLVSNECFGGVHHGNTGF